MLVRLYTDSAGEVSYDYDVDPTDEQQTTADVPQGALDWLDRAVASRSDAESYVLQAGGYGSPEDLQNSDERPDTNVGWQSYEEAD